MNNPSRIKELNSYNISYTTKELAFDDIVQIASTICDTAFSVITFFDEKTQYFKATYGLDLVESPLELSFCKYTINKPNEYLIVNDATNTSRFKNHPLVVNNPYVRFYLGIPLVSPNGLVIGTLSVSDTKPKNLSNRQLSALKLLANRIMDKLNNNRELALKEKRIQHEEKRLKHLADMAPSVLFQLERSSEGKLFYSFLSKGFYDLFPDADYKMLMSDLQPAFQRIHPDDLETIKNSAEQSYKNEQNWSCIFRIFGTNDTILWFAVQATINKHNDGSATWYGSYQNITNIKIYEEVLEQISFDISHVLRKPISTLMGLTSLINEEKHSIDTILDYSKHINTVSAELDEFTHKLNEAYQLKKELFLNSKTINL